MRRPKLAPLAGLALSLPLALAACRDDTTFATPDAGAPPADLAAAPSSDLAGGPGPKPLGGTVTQQAGPMTGQVDRLYFGFTGDTRPSNMDDTAHYPVATITQIFSRLAQADVQFTVDLGDHMYIVSAVADAPVQMNLYTTAAQMLGTRPLFMVLGNHDCGAGNCFYSMTDPNYTAYMNALKPTAALPYYSFTVQTQSGPAVFVILSDNYTGGEVFTWFDKTLADADKTAKYTIVARHHPIGTAGTSYGVTEQILKQHKYALFMTGHAHHYERDVTGDPSGRTIIYGLGGVPNSGPNWGYGIVQQGIDDRLYVTVYESATNMPYDSWSVGPNQ